MKIDPRTLRPKLHAISQHAAEDGVRVTTAINLVPAAPDPLENLLTFAADTSNFSEGHSEDNETEEDISRGYYVA